MEDHREVPIPARPIARTAGNDEIDDDPHEEAHGRRRLREMLVERESATERFRALKRRLLAKG